MDADKQMTEQETQDLIKAQAKIIEAMLHDRIPDGYGSKSIDLALSDLRESIVNEEIRLMKCRKAWGMDDHT
jgi:hypothetical protein